MLWLALLFISNTWLVASSNCPSGILYDVCAHIPSAGPATCANGIVQTSLLSTTFNSCYWDSSQPTICLEGPTCTPMCSTERSLNVSTSACSTFLEIDNCNKNYIVRGGIEHLCVFACDPDTGCSCTEQPCYDPGNCPATTAIGSCSGVSQITCPTKFVWNNGTVNNCVWNSSTSTCVASANTCVPPCLPVGRNPTSACSSGTSVTCLGLTSTSTSKYCVWNGSACVDDLPCYTKPNCPTATTAVGSCSGLSSTACPAGFTWNNGPIDNCSWNGSSCVEVASPCTPPCIPTGGGRTNGICSSQSTSLTCIMTSNTSTKRYCYWTGSSCVEQELCH